MSFRTFTGVVSQGVAGDPLWNNLLSYYNFDGNVLDSKGTDDGTPTSITYTTGINLSGGSFNGSSSKVAVGTNWSFDYNTPWTFSLWFKRASTGTGVFVLLSDLASSPFTEANLDMFINSNEINIQILSSGTNRIIVKKTSFAVNTNWNHFVLTYNGSTNASGVTMYLNSTDTALSVAADTLTAAIVSDNTFTWGFRSSNHYWNGLLDEIGVWDKELSQAEVDELWNSGTGKFFT